MHSSWCFRISVLVLVSVQETMVTPSKYNATAKIREVVVDEDVLANDLNYVIRLTWVVPEGIL